MPKYAGTERDSNGLDHTWWRKLESTSGRWTSADPYKGSMSIADPQSFNRYSYVENDPVNLVDPTGLMCYLRVEVWNVGGRESTRVIGVWCDPSGMPPATSATPARHEDGDRQKSPTPQSPTLDELIHCNPDVKKQIDAMFSLQQSSRSGGSKGLEYGFRVDLINGQYKVSDLYKGPSGTEITVPLNQNSVARFHTHQPWDPNPSTTDRANANKYNVISYVKTFGNLKLYNPQNPKDASGKDRIVAAQKCPHKNN